MPAMSGLSSCLYASIGSSKLPHDGPAKAIPRHAAWLLMQLLRREQKTLLRGCVSFGNAFRQWTTAQHWSAEDRPRDLRELQAAPLA